ncbi:hypothetical protein ACHQM5_028238 [Ranunculus cassubicifolius]
MDTSTGRSYTSKLAMLESGLAKSRSLIQEAIKRKNHTYDPDYIPHGAVYHNSHAFQRSYMEMEKHFKVFVYEEGEPPVFHTGPCKGIYSSEGLFISQMDVDSLFRTKDPEKAHVYFLPFSITWMVKFVHHKGSRSFMPIKQTVADYINDLATKYPYWNRSLGGDHFMLACHDWGPYVSSYVPNLYNNSIRVLCSANTSEGFRPSKDVTLPEMNLVWGTTKGLIGGPSPSQRTLLAFFAGAMHGPIRPILLHHWMNKDKDIHVSEKLPKNMSYYTIMRKSKYCLCPSGYEVASPRIVEAIYTGCVPVLISDHYVPPFSDVLNWKSFSVEVKVSNISELKNILLGISEKQYLQMQRRGMQIRRHFELNYPPKRFDVYHMILHSVWLRRLNVQIHDFERTE